MRTALFKPANALVGFLLQGADETSDPKAENHLLETGGIPVSARQLQRLVQRAGAAAQAWHERPAQPGGAGPTRSVSADATGVPMRTEELVGRTGTQADGRAQTRSASLRCVFPQHQTEEEGHPVRDDESTTAVSRFGSIEGFGPGLRHDARCWGLALALQVLVRIDGAEGLAKRGRLCLPGALPIVDFSHALEHAGQVRVARRGSKEHPDDQKRLGRGARRLRRDHGESLIAQAVGRVRGRTRAPSACWRCAASTAVVTWRSSGRTCSRPTPPAPTAWPSPHRRRRFLSCAQSSHG